MASKLVIDLASRAVVKSGVAGVSRRIRYSSISLNPRLRLGPILLTKLPSIRQRRLLRHIHRPHRPTIESYPRNVFPGSFIDKGCSAAIIGVTNRGYESKIILKQPYKYGFDCLETESKFLIKLQNHPNIIQFIGECKIPICQDPIFKESCPDVEHFGVADSIILERMDFNLETLLKHEDLNIIDRIDMLTQILEAEVYMRRKRICHRDMKPNNILGRFVDVKKTFLKNPTRILIKVADFDCSLDLNSAKSNEIDHQGTSDRTSPEILNSIKRNESLSIDTYAKSDIWAIGILGYEIFNNCNPFLKVNVESYSLEDLPPVFSAPTIVEKVIKSLLNPDPNLRYKSCIASDILQMFRLKTLVSESLTNLFKDMSFHMIVGCCWMHEMYFTAERFALDENRLKYTLTYLDEP